MEGVRLPSAVRMQPYQWPLPHGSGNYMHHQQKGACSSQTAPVRDSGSQREVYETSTSFEAALSNAAVPLETFSAAQFRTPVQNISCRPQPSETNVALQQVYKNKSPMRTVHPVQNNPHTVTVAWLPNACTYGLKDNQIHGSVPHGHQASNQQPYGMQSIQQPASQPQQTASSVQMSQTTWLPSNNQDQMGGAGTGASYVSAHLPHSVAQGLPTSSLPSQYITKQSPVSYSQTQYSTVNQAHHTSVVMCASPTHKTQNSVVGLRQTKSNVNMGQSSYGTNQSFVFQSQPTQRINQSNQSSSVSSPQENMQARTQYFGQFVKETQTIRQTLQPSNNIPNSGQHNNMRLQAVPAHQSNTGPQLLHSNSQTNRLSRTLLETYLTSNSPPSYSLAISYSTPKAPPPNPRHTSYSNTEAPPPNPRHISYSTTEASPPNPRHIRYSTTEAPPPNPGPISYSTTEVPPPFPGHVRYSTTEASPSIPGPINCYTTVASPSIHGPINCSTSEASPSIPGPNNYSSTIPLLFSSKLSARNMLLQKQKRQVPVQNHNTNSPSSHNSFGVQVAGHGGGHHQATQEQILTKTTNTSVCSKTQATTSNCSVLSGNHEIQSSTKYQVTAKNSLKEHKSQSQPDLKRRNEGVQSCKPQLDCLVERSNEQMSAMKCADVQYSINPAECLEVIKALQKRAALACRAVAVVPPISQQEPDPEQNNVSTCADEGLPFKTGAVCSEIEKSEDKDTLSNAPDLPIKRNDYLHLQSQESIKLGNESKDDVPYCDMPPYGNEPITGITVTQFEKGTTSQNSNLSQGPNCSADLMAKNPEQNDNQDAESDLTNTTFDISKLPVFNVTLKNLYDLIKTLEDLSIEEKKDTVEDVFKCILDLYWGGDQENVKKGIKAAMKGWMTTSMRVCIKQDAVLFHHIERKHYKMLAQRYFILQNETTLPAGEFMEFKSSWQNTDGQLPDIDNILKESDYELTCHKDVCVGQVNVGDAEGLSESIHKESTKTPLDNITEQRMITPHRPPQSKNLTETTVMLDDIEIFNRDIVKLEYLLSKLSKEKESREQQCPTPKQELQGDVDKQDDFVLIELPGRLNESNYKTRSKNKDHRDIIEDVCLSSEILKSKANLTEQNNHKPTNTELPVFASQMRSYDECAINVGNAKDRCEKDVTEIANSTNDCILLEVILPSSDNAKTDFKEHSNGDIQTEFLKFGQDVPKLSTICSLSKLDQVSSKTGIKTLSPPNLIKFTCPHITDTGNGDYFCPNCWDETPLLDIDLDESLLTPQEGGINIVITSSKQSDESEKCGTPSVKSPVKKPVAPACVDSDIECGVEVTPKVDSSDITSSPKPDDESQSCSITHGEPPVVQPILPVCQDNSSSVQLAPKIDRFDIMDSAERCDERQCSTTSSDEPPVLQPVLEPLQVECLESSSAQSVTEKKTEVPSLASAEIAEALSHSESKEKRKPVTSSQFRRVTQTVPLPEQSSRIKLISKPETNPADLYRLGKRVLKKTARGHLQENNGTKQSGQNGVFALYGHGKKSSNKHIQHQCHDGKKTSVPICLTVSSQAGKNYTDLPSAKEKIYSMWRNAFVPTVQNPTKSQKRKNYELAKRKKLEKYAEGILKLRGGLKRKISFDMTPDRKRLNLTSPCL